MEEQQNPQKSAHIFMESGAGGRSTVLTPTLAAKPLVAANSYGKFGQKTLGQGR